MGISVPKKGTLQNSNNRCLSRQLARCSPWSWRLLLNAVSKSFKITATLERSMTCASWHVRKKTCNVHFSTMFWLVEVANFDGVGFFHSQPWIYCLHRSTHWLRWGLDRLSLRSRDWKTCWVFHFVKGKGWKKTKCWILLLMEEILHQLVGRLYHYLQGFIHPRWWRISFINSMAEKKHRISLQND